MPRAPRIHFRGALFHAIARGNGGQTIFEDELDYGTFLNHLAIVKDQRPFRLYAYCLMPNHIHLLIQMAETPIWKVMQRVMLRYAQSHNKRRNRKGHVFQARYKPILCSEEGYLLTLLRYIHLNPVRAFLCKHPNDWPWSSHRVYMRGWEDGGLVDISPPLSILGEEPATARSRLGLFVEEGIGLVTRKDVQPTTRPECLGPTDFISDYDRMTEEKKMFRPPKPPSLSELAKGICNEMGISEQELRSGGRRRPLPTAKRRLAVAALKCGRRQAEVAAYLNCTSGAIFRLIERQS